MKKRISAIIIAVCIAIALVPAAALAAPDNPPAGIVDELAQNDDMYVNDGTVITNRGTIGDNNGTVDINYGTVHTNYSLIKESNGNINLNNGTVNINRGPLSYNNGTVAINEDELIENEISGIVEDNKASVYKNYGTVKINSGHIEDNYGVIEDMPGMVQKNFGTIKNFSGILSFNYGTIESGDGFVYNNFYKLDLSGLDKVMVIPDDPNYIEEIDGVTYVNDCTTLTIKAEQGYTLKGAPTVLGCDILFENEDGSYTAEDIQGDVSITAEAGFVPTTDIINVPETFGLKEVVSLADAASLVPSGANKITSWSVVDDGGTGTVMATDSHELVWVGGTEGTVTLRAAVDMGISESEPFVKDFTVRVIDDIAPMCESFKAVEDADDIDELKAAVADFYNYVEDFSNLNDDRVKIFADKLGLSEEDAYMYVLDTWITANVTLSVDNLYKEFEADKNAETAQAFLEYYGFIFLGNEEFLSREMMEYVEGMIPDIHERYEQTVYFLGGNSGEEGGKEEEKDDGKDEEKDDGSGYDGPKTGDDTNIVLPTTLIIACASTLILCIIRMIVKKKRNSK